MQGPPRALHSWLQPGASACSLSIPTTIPTSPATMVLPAILLCQVGTLLESGLVRLLFSLLGFHFYSAVSPRSFRETCTTYSCVLKLNEILEEQGGCRRLGELRMVNC